MSGFNPTNNPTSRTKFQVHSYFRNQACAAVSIMVASTERNMPMLLTFPIWALVSSMSAQARTSPSLHMVVESQFIYMSSTQTSTVEYWIAEDKSYEKRGARVTITRKDRGVRWIIDTQKQTYVESTLADAAKQQAVTEDMHTAGFNYEPEFAWTVTDTKQTSIINGRSCRLTIANGTADFADASLKLWLARSDRQGVEAGANGPIVDSTRFRYQNPATYITRLLAKRPGTLLMSLDATVEPPIAPTMVHHVLIRTIETGQAPAGTFDLPAGLLKIS